MSAGTGRADRLMYRLSGAFGTARISSECYNRIYEAVLQLPDTAAESMVKAIEKELKSRTDNA